MKAHTESKVENTNGARGTGRGADLFTDGLPVLLPINPTKAERSAGRRARKSQAPSGAGVELAPVGALKSAAAVETMAAASAEGFRKRWEACGGRELSASDVAEARCVYHAAFAGAAVRSGVVPLVPVRTLADGQTVGEPLRGLVVRRENPLRARSLQVAAGLGWSVTRRVWPLLQWRRALKAANRRVRSLLWGGGAELLIEAGRVVSWDDLQSLKGTMEGGAGRTVGESISLADTATYARPFSGAARRSLRLRVWWYRQALVVFWSDKGGQRWERGLSDDLRRLAHCARVARNGGLLSGIFADSLSEGGECGEAARQAAKRLRDRIGAGDAIMTARPDMADGFLRIYRPGVAWDTRPARRGETERRGFFAGATVREGAGWARFMSSPVGIVERDNGVSRLGFFKVRRPSFGGFILSADGAARLGAFSCVGDAPAADGFKLSSYARAVVELGAAGARGAATDAARAAVVGAAARAATEQAASDAARAAWLGAQAARKLADGLAADVASVAARAVAARRLRAALPALRAARRAVAEAAAKARAAREAEALAVATGRGVASAYDKRRAAGREAARALRVLVMLKRGAGRPARAIY